MADEQIQPHIYTGFKAWLTAPCGCQMIQHNGKGRPVELRPCKLHGAADTMGRALRAYVALDPRCQRGATHCGECAACMANDALHAAGLLE